MYNPESASCADLMVSDEVVELNVTLSTQSAVMTEFSEVMNTIILVLNSHIPIDTVELLISVTLLPTGTGFSEAYILWL